MDADGLRQPCQLPHGIPARPGVPPFRVGAPGVLLLVDAAHSLGTLRIPVEACDGIVSCGHKFLFGVHGTGILYDRRDVAGDMASLTSRGDYSTASFEVEAGRPVFALKPGARSYEVGNPNHAGLAILREGMALMERVDLGRLEAHAMALARRMRQELVTRGWPMWTPLDLDRHGPTYGQECPKPLAKRSRSGWMGTLRPCPAADFAANDKPAVHTVADLQAVNLVQPHPGSTPRHASGRTAPGPGSRPTSAVSRPR